MAETAEEALERRGASPSSATLRGGRAERSASSPPSPAPRPQGVEVDWKAVFGPGARRVALPTYAFQHRRYWLDVPPAPATSPPSASSAPPTPSWVPPSPSPARGAGLLTGKLSLKTHPWLADHAVMGAALLPGTAFVELALRAGEQAGAICSKS